MLAVEEGLDARSWLTGQGNMKDTLHSMKDKLGFNIKICYLKIMPLYKKVGWDILVLTKGMIPTHNFIVWVALHRILATIERVIKWGIQVNADCVLCTTQLEITCSLNVHTQLICG
ncbi:hypothetical protein HAX54_014580 [Datura stramonium]|uniref:Reverse transcriptase zinc-binding domain-containing protein n=1 Tax=Datura stramonium TaxID=4076 RepID=A0ABS8TPA0_DATST|nr:hypothetical protein [Datura stramonium]